jgi:hypothetical protein
MKKIYLPLVALIALSVAGCWPGVSGSGHIVDDKRPVTDFSDINAGGMFQIEWHPGSPSLTITTDDNLLKYIESRVEGTTLRLDSSEHVMRTRHIKVLVTSPRFTGARLSGAVRFTATQLTGPKFYLETSGASRINLSGTVDELIGEMSGATRLEAEDLHTKSADIDLSGASRAKVFASETLRVSISGAGKVTYFGHPKVERHISGAGSINPGD